MAQWLKEFPPVRSTPRLWVSTLWLVESREPLALTRTVELRQGLNIVWARESAADASPGLSSAGHGVGKTSLCLLMRYVLGDDAPAIGVLRDKAAGSFPKGGVAARVHIEGSTWVVLRPYGAHAHSLAGRVDTLDALLEGSRPHEFAEYLAALEAFSIGRLPAQSLPGTNQALKWRHLLAWCIRDQRRRFDGFYHWRDGEGLGFSRPRRDPPIFVSSVLGLVDTEMDQVIRSVESRQTELERAEARLPELEREPELILNTALRQMRLRVNAGDDEPVFRSTASDSIEARVTAAIEAAVASEGDLERQSEDAEEEALAALAHLRDLQHRASLAEAEVGIARARVEANHADFLRFITLRERLQNPTGRCDLGGVELSDCVHVQERRSRIELTWIRDGREVKLSAGDLARQLQSREQEALAASALVAAQEREVSARRSNVRRMRMRIATSETSRSTLKAAWDALSLQHQQRSSGSDSPELVRAREGLNAMRSELDGLRAKLAIHRSQQTARSDSLKALTVCVSERMLGASDHARFVPGHEYRPFEVAKGGEAYQVLEVLLGDLVCLIDSAASAASRHPGFLIHDCPREADMSERLYRSYFITAAEAADQLCAPAGVPFQFIVTTTSPPPPDLRSDRHIVLELTPGLDEGLLFKRELMPSLPGFDQG